MASIQQKVSRGEVWIADLDPGFGVEIRKKRPVLIVSTDVLNYHWPRVVILPFSSIVHPLNEFKIFVPKDILQLAKDSVILVQEIRSIDRARFIKMTGRLSKQKMQEVEEALKLVLGITPLD